MDESSTIQGVETLSRKLISSDSEFEAKIGYSRAVVDVDYVFVAGTAGYNYQEMTISESVVEQAEQCFRNIEAALKEAGSSIRDIVRITYILPNKKDFEPCWPVFAKWLGSVRPAATMFEAGLLSEEMKIEIQVTARKSALR
ncbi:MAG: RidA family protein [Desulfobacterales bacterium]|nr:RidA family protein [Desulfobacterales bacterium]